MTYAAQETSIQDGQPLELYDFQWSTSRELYCSGQEDYDDNGDIYRATPIKRSGTSINSAGKVSKIKLEVPRDFQIAALHVANIPGRTVWLEIKRLHLSDGVTPEIVTYWKGRVIGTEFIGATAEVECEPIDAILEKEGLRRSYQFGCPHMLYSGDCQLLKELWQQNVAGGSITHSGTTITSAAFGSYADGWFVNGWIVQNGLYQRLIVGHTGNDLTVLEPFYDTGPADFYVAYAGCDRTWATCRDKFSNGDNYGGFRHIPTNNPFENGLEGQ